MTLSFWLLRLSFQRHPSCINTCPAIQHATPPMKFPFLSSPRRDHLTTCFPFPELLFLFVLNSPMKSKPSKAYGSRKNPWSGFSLFMHGLLSGLQDLFLSNFPSGCCWEATCSHNKNHLKGPGPATTLALGRVYRGPD